MTGYAEGARSPDPRSRTWIVSPDFVGLALPFWLLVITAAVALIVGLNTPGDNGGARDIAVGVGFYGGLVGIWMMGPYAVGYIAARIIAIASSARPAALLGYAGLVASLVIAIFVNKWAALILGAIPSAGVLASAASYALAHRSQ